MVSKKTLFLTKITEEIATLQAAYEACKDLPEKIFDTISSTMNGADMGEGGVKTNYLLLSQSNDNSEVDGKRGVVYGIIKKAGCAVKKREILRIFFELNPKVKNPEASVTFALTALRTEKKIKSYNPSPTGNVKLGYWTLPEWWDGDNLMDRHKPSPPQVRLAV